MRLKKTAAGFLVYDESTLEDRVDDLKESIRALYANGLLPSDGGTMMPQPFLIQSVRDALDEYEKAWKETVK